jgi:hypothetical protein
MKGTAVHAAAVVSNLQEAIIASRDTDVAAVPQHQLQLM